MLKESNLHPNCLTQGKNKVQDSLKKTTNYTFDNVKYTMTIPKTPDTQRKKKKEKGRKHDP